MVQHAGSPPLDTQRQIVMEIEAERALVEANRKLVEIFEKKIQTKLSGIGAKMFDHFGFWCDNDKRSDR